MPTKEFYLQYRNLFITLNLINEVQQLDVHYKLVFLYSKEGMLIKIM